MLALLSTSLPALGEESAPADALASPAQSDAPAGDAQAIGQAEATLGTIPVKTPEVEAPPPEPPSVKNRAVEEVIVTAQKRSENIQDVPISIQAFSGDALAARGIANTAQLGQSVPSLQFTLVQGFSLIYIRGLGTDNFVPSAEPSIAQYVDGIYVPQGQSTVNSLGNVERVEVLKGPQGTLFGRNATGGAISITTEEPGNTFKASAELSGGNFNYRSVKGNVSGPVTDWFSAAVSGVYSTQDSYYTNVNYDIQKTTLGAYRVKLAFHPSEDLSIGLTGYHADQQGINSLIGANTDPTVLGRLLLIQPAPDTYTVNSDYEAGATAKQDLYYGNATWETSLVDLKLLLSDQHLLNHSEADFDGSNVPLVGFELPRGFVDQRTAELQFISNPTTPFSDHFKWVAGLYYLKSNAGISPTYLHAAPQALTSAFAIAGLPIPQGLKDLIPALGLQNTPLGTEGLIIPFSGELGTHSYSAYTQGTYSFNDSLDFTLGGRFQREKRFLTKSEVTVLNPVGGQALPPPINFELKGTTDTNFSPKAVLSWHLSDDQLLYASYSVGYKSGTYNIANIYVPPNYIVPEEVTSYEVGGKFDFLDGLLRVNGAVFDNEIKNLQSGFVSLVTGGVVRFLTVPKARSRGAEIDGTWLPMPDLNQGLVLTANAAYIHATYIDFENGSGFDPETGLYSGNLDFSGNRIVRTPKLSGGVGLVQAIDLDSGSIELAIDGYYNSGFYYDSYNTIKEKAYAILNGHIGYLYAPWNTRLTLFGNNLLDRRYHVQQFQDDFGITKNLAAPREFGLRLNWDF